MTVIFLIEHEKGIYGHLISGARYTHTAKGEARNLASHGDIAPSHLNYVIVIRTRLAIAY